MAIIILILHLLLLSTTTFTLWPEMVVYPYLINNGFNLYSDIVNPYPPALPYFLAIFSSILGYNPFPYQILTWMIILLTDLLIFILTKKMYKSTNLAYISTIFFAIFSIPFGVNGLWFDLIQTPFILIAFYLLTRIIDSKTIRISPSILFLLITSLSWAFFIKQQVAWTILTVTALIAFILKVRFIKPAIQNFYFGIPVVVFVLLHSVFLMKRNILDQFAFWTINFPILKASSQPGYVLLPTPKNLVVVLALILFFLPFFLHKNKRPKYLFVVLISLLFFAYPRFDYFHLIPFLAAASLLIPENVRSFKTSNLKLKLLTTTSLVILILFSINFYLDNSNNKVRFFENEIFSAAKILNFYTKPEDLIYIQNGPDQLLPLSERLPPKPWADEFPWYLEVDNFDSKIKNAIEKQKPKYVVYQPYQRGKTYDLGSYRPEEIANFLDTYYRANFKLNENLWLKIRN